MEEPLNRNAKNQPAPDTGSGLASALKRPLRAVDRATSLFLYVQAGGRCSFDGCNDYLLEHYPSETPGNFAEQAHIWAFSESGPRGQEEGRPEDINALSNLILLCQACHKLVDDNPGKYTVAVLRRFKADHEDRVHWLTGLSKNRDTLPLVLKGLVAGRRVEITDEEMQEAIAPNYLKQRQKLEIDLTALPDQASGAFWESGRAAIDHKLSHLATQSVQASRMSVFALAPIPLLIYLGSRLSDKMTVDLYQRHRAPETWRWHDGLGAAVYKTTCIREQPGGETVLLVNLSGRNALSQLPTNLAASAVWELTLDGQDPSPMFLRTRADLDRFIAEYMRALARIREACPKARRLHLLPAVPAPVAVAIGRQRLPKVDAPMLVYDRDARAGGFTPTLEIT